MNEYSFDDIKVGMVEEFEVEITENMLNLFLEISGDNNPIHIYDEYAKSVGMNKKVVYGMVTASFYSKLVGVYLPGKKCLLQEMKVSFNKPVYVGNILKIVGTVERKIDIFKRIDIDAYILNQDNIKVSSAKIKVGMI